MAIFRPTHPDIDRINEGDNTDLKKKKSVDLLSRRLIAPSFDDLPIDNDLDETYYAPNRYGVYSVSRTWVFLGEITDCNRILPLLRYRALVTDRNGRTNIPLWFYPKSGCFDYNSMKVGHTMAAIFAEQHYFMDGSIGLRLEDLNHVKVIPCGLNDLLELSKHYSSSKGKCWGCGQEGKTLKKCGACKTGFYCDEKCQRQDWTKRHKKWCKAMPDFLFLSSLDYGIANSKAVWR